MTIIYRDTVISLIKRETANSLSIPSHGLTTFCKNPISVHCSMFKGSSGCRINYWVDSPPDQRQRITYAGSCNWLDVQLSTTTFFFTVIFATILILMVILGTGYNFNSRCTFVVRFPDKYGSCPISPEIVNFCLKISIFSLRNSLFEA